MRGKAAFMLTRNGLAAIKPQAVSSHRCSFRGTPPGLVDMTMAGLLTRGSLHIPPSRRSVAPVAVGLCSPPTVAGAVAELVLCTSPRSLFTRRPDRSGNHRQPGCRMGGARSTGFRALSLIVSPSRLAGIAPACVAATKGPSQGKDHDPCAPSVKMAKQGCGSDE